MHAQPSLYDVRPGFCHCGCGRQTRIAPRSIASIGWVRGQPIRFIQGHQSVGRGAWRALNNYTVCDQGFDTPCWIWGGTVTSVGYGILHVWGGGMGAHRFFYWHFVGPIPDGLELDHLCCVRDCVNPDHLEAVTPLENTRRAQMARVFKVSDGMVRLIRQSPSKGTRDLARRLGVSYTYVSHVRARRLRSSVPD